MRQPVERVPDTIIARIGFLLERRNLTVDQLAQRMGVTPSSLAQAMSRRTITSLLSKIAEAFGISERVLADEKLSDETVLQRSVLAMRAQTKQLHSCTIGRIAWEDVEKGFGRGRFALLDGNKEEARPGELVAYWSEVEDGYVVRRLGEGGGKHVVLLNPHVDAKTEVKTVQWANTHLRRVLAICDVKDPTIAPKQ